MKIFFITSGPGLFTKMDSAKSINICPAVPRPIIFVKKPADQDL